MTRTMKYANIVHAAFHDRSNRFVARVHVCGQLETVHVKNTGRLAELFIPGAEVWLTDPGTPGRKTRYDLVTVRKENGTLFNIDSQAPNRAVAEWLAMQGFDRVIPEYRYGDSRIDFYMERGGEKYLLEIKGCTLERDGVGYFPDAPTARGLKHLFELTRAVQKGYHAMLGFVIQMDGITEVRPNLSTHPAFGTAMKEAQRAGVRILFLRCHVEPDSLDVIDVREKIGQI